MAEESGFDKDEAIFLSVMYSFHAAAMQQMGKIANPFTGKVERDLDAARGTIDVLAVFQKKTQGNLSERERRTLTNLITELQLNYVDETKKEAAPAEAEGAAQEEASPAEGAAAGTTEGPVVTPPSAEEDKAEPKEVEKADEEKAGDKEAVGKGSEGKKKKKGKE